LRAHDFGASKNRAAANNPTPSKTSSLGIFRTPPPSDAPPPSLALLGSSRLFKVAHLDRHLRYPERKPRGPPGASNKRLLMRRVLFDAVVSPFVITRGGHPRYGREVANGHPFPPAGDAIELAGTV